MLELSVCLICIRRPMYDFLVVDTLLDTRSSDAHIILTLLVKACECRWCLHCVLPLWDYNLWNYRLGA